jgi:uncharacterized protein (DUF1697 family)
MPRYAAFLRGINVGGHRIASDRLRAHLAGMGFTDVATFRASGNVILSADGDASQEEVAARLEGGLGEALGYAVPVFLRTAAQVRSIASHAPFAAEVVEASRGKLQVALLLSKPTASARKGALALATDEDRLAIRGRELYWLPSGGMLESELDQKALARLLGASTTRTKGTMDQVAARYFA